MIEVIARKVKWEELGFEVIGHANNGYKAIASGMKKVKEYADSKNTISYAYAITREEWERIKTDCKANS